MSKWVSGLKQGRKGPSGRPRVTYIHHHYREPHESGGTRSWEFARRLVRDGYAVTMISGSPGVDGVNDEGIRVRYMGVAYDNSRGFVGRIASFAKFAMKATIVATTTPSDLIFATSTPLTVALPARFASAVRRVPYVFEVRDVWPKVPIELGVLRNPLLIEAAERLEKWAYSGASAIVALSPGMQSDVQSVTPCKDVHMIPNAADIDAFLLPDAEVTKVRERLGWEGPTVIYAGSLGEANDPEWLVRLTYALKKLNIRMIIYGTGGPLHRCRELASSLGLDAEEVLPGAVPKKAIMERLGAADLLVSSLIDNSSLEDNSLNKVFDGLAAGRPLVFNHHGWLANLCVTESAGWIVGRDIDAAARKIRELLLDEPLLAYAGATAERIGRLQFSRDALYDEWRQVLDSALAIRRS